MHNFRITFVSAGFANFAGAEAARLGVTCTVDGRCVSMAVNDRSEMIDWIRWAMDGSNGGESGGPV